MYSDEGEHIRCDQVFTPNRFKLQVHFEHIPPLYEYANLAKIHCQASLVGTHGYAISLGDCNGMYKVDGFREIDIDKRDSAFSYSSTKKGNSCKIDGILMRKCVVFFFSDNALYRADRHICAARMQAYCSVEGKVQGALRGCVNSGEGMFIKGEEEGHSHC